LLDWKISHAGVLLEHSLDIHAGMVVERRYDTLVDVFPARMRM
jgi:hypothetical protein